MDGGMATLDKQQSHAGLSGAEQQASRQSATYWHGRIHATLERLERDARRMLQLESELSVFARSYYDAVGDATERLAQIEQQLAPEPINDMVSAMPAVMEQRDVAVARQVELKARYRSLAKEIHPDRVMVVEGAGSMANNMHSLNAAYQHGDLAALLALEARMHLAPMMADDATVTADLQNALRDVERAADTYADGYRAMLGSPLNELMLRAMSARLAGWDWMEAVRRKIERSIEEKERALVEAGIAQIGAWRAETVSAA
jgi:hypothetical protein